MTDLIPATTPYVAVFERQRNGSTYKLHKPVLAWDQYGNVYVNAPRDSGLHGVHEEEGFVGTQEAPASVVSAVPGDGWQAEYKDDQNGTLFTSPIVAWAIRANGTCFPIAVDNDGGNGDPTADDNFVRLIPPRSSAATRP